MAANVFLEHEYAQDLTAFLPLTNFEEFFRGIFISDILFESQVIDI